MNEAISLATEFEAVENQIQREKLRKPQNGGLCRLEGSNEKNEPRHSNDRDMSQVQCYYCKQMGHYKRYCPKRPKQYHTSYASNQNKASQRSQVPNQGN